MRKFKEIYDTIEEYGEDIPDRYRSVQTKILKSVASLVSEYVLTDIELALIWTSYDNLLDEVISLPSLWSKNVQDNIIFFIKYLREYAYDEELYETLENFKRFSQYNFFEIKELKGYEKTD